MKSKLSRFAVPYVVWMAIFVVAPIVIMVVYAFAGSEGGYTLDNFVFDLCHIAKPAFMFVCYHNKGSAARFQQVN